MPEQPYGWPPETQDTQVIGNQPARPATVVTGRRRAAQVAKILLTVVSVVVFAVTAYGWTSITQLTSGLSTQNVIDPGKQVSPLSEQNILVVGLDTRTDAQGNPLPADVLNQLHAGGADDGGDTTDTMIVIHIPAGGGAATAISIPRDSYVQLAGGYGKHKINSAYTNGKVDAQKQLSAKGVTGNDLETQSDAAGAKTAIQTVESFTGLSITHYAAVNLAGFYYISQAVGGVPVCLNNAVHDSYSGANFQAGPQTVEGAAALEFVRQRHGLPDGDLDRIKRQQAFMSGMAKTVLSAGTLANPVTLSNLIAAVKKAVVIDQGWDILQFAQQLQGMSAGSIKFVTIPIVSITLQTPEDGDAVEVDPQQVQQFIQTTIGSTGNGSPAAPTTSAAASNNSATTVDVYNGSGVSGLAGRVMSTLTGDGFTQGTTGNAAARKSSVVDYAAGESDAAKAIAQALGGLTTAEDTNIASGHVRVYLGSSYSGPGAQGFANGPGYVLNGGAHQAAATTSAGPTTASNGAVCIN